MKDELGVFALLFAVAFAAATLLPLQSEALLSGLIIAGYEPIAMVAVASLGNIAGSMMNWWLGRQIERFQARSWFPVRPAQMERARRAYARYGRWALLAAWLPVIGDPITLVAGVLRERLRVFVPLVGLGKTGRYAAVAYGALWLA